MLRYDRRAEVVRAWGQVWMLVPQTPGLWIGVGREADGWGQGHVGVKIKEVVVISVGLFLIIHGF